MVFDIQSCKGCSDLFMLTSEETTMCYQGVRMVLCTVLVLFGVYIIQGFGRILHIEYHIVMSEMHGLVVI